MKKLIRKILKFIEERQAKKRIIDFQEMKDDYYNRYF